MKANHFTRVIAGCTAFALFASMPIQAQGTAPPPPSQASPALIKTGGLETLPSNVHLEPPPDGGHNEIMMTSVGHVTPPPPGPPPDGAAVITSLPNGGKGVDPGKLVFSLKLKPGQRVPGYVGLWISDAGGHIVFQTSSSCTRCRTQSGTVNLGLDAKAAAAIRPFLVSGNTIHLITTTRMATGSQIQTSIGMRAQ